MGKPLFQYGYGQGIYTTPIMQYTRRTLVPSGMLDILEQETAQMLAYRIKKQTDELMLRRLSCFTEITANQNAYFLLEQYRKQIAWTFSEKYLLLLEGAVHIACRGKVLDHRGEIYFRQWIEEIRKQLEEVVVPQKKISRCFYGFRYMNEYKELVSVIEVQAHRIYERLYQLEMQGFVTTPIYSCIYGMETFQDLPDMRKKFRLELETMQDVSYFQLIASIRNLPGVIDPQMLKSLEYNNGDNSFIQNTIQYYRTIWNPSIG